MKCLNSLAALLWLSSTSVMAADSAETLKLLQDSWALNNYSLSGGAQEKAFTRLLQQADSALQQYPSDAPIIIWHGIINSSYAGVVGGLGALQYAKTAKADFEKAIKLDPMALQGSAYTSLGVLYFKVPGWPIGFGDDDKAEQLLQQALTLNPEGIDANYFYGEYLLEDERYDQAQQYLEKAAQAAPRAGRETADAGRHKEIDAALAKLKKQR